MEAKNHDIWFQSSDSYVYDDIAEMGNFSVSQFYNNFLPNGFAFWQFSTPFELFTQNIKEF